MRGALQRLVRGPQIPASPTEQIVAALREGRRVHAEDIPWLVHIATKAPRTILIMMAVLWLIVGAGMSVAGWRIGLAGLAFGFVLLIPLPLLLWWRAVRVARTAIVHGRVVAGRVRQVRPMTLNGQPFWMADADLEGIERSRVSFSEEGERSGLSPGDEVHALVDPERMPRVALVLGVGTGVLPGRCRWP